MFEIRCRPAGQTIWAWVVWADDKQVALNECRTGKMVRYKSRGGAYAMIKRIQRSGLDGDFKVVAA